MNMTQSRFFKTTIVLCILLSAFASYDITYAEQLCSPDGKVIINTSLKAGEPYYNTSWKGRKLINDSALGIELKENPFVGGFAIVESTRKSSDSTWKPVWGKFSQIRDNYNQLTLDLLEQGPLKRKMKIVFRAYNDGIAFRYVFDQQPQLKKFTINSENTEFCFAADHTVWYLSHKWGVTIDGPVKLTNAAESEELVNTPMTIKVSDDCYLCIHEAALDKYASMNLDGIAAKPFALKSKLAGKAYLATPTKTPWRVVMFADNCTSLLESNIMVNLNEPCVLKKTDWIKPGKTMWDWQLRGAQVDGFTYTLSTESMKRLIDFASDNNVQYAMVDAGWYGPEWKATSNPMTCVNDINIPYLAQYAKEKNVGLWVYINNIALKKYDLDKTLSTYKKWGVLGIKHGFLCNPTQKGVDFCHKVLKKCAKYEIMYDCHECMKPNGFERTYPNFMTREYSHSLADGHRIGPPSYIVKMAFVNMLAGPLDHTPGMFNINTASEREHVNGELKTTVAAQTARCLVIYTPLLCLPDHGQAYKKKADLFEFIKQLPMNWDLTKVINGKIGEYITTARRSGDQWFVGSLTDESARTLDIPLDFLGTERYMATIYADANDAHYIENREAYAIKTISVTSKDTIKARLAPGGGHSMWIRPIEKEK